MATELLPRQLFENLVGQLLDERLDLRVGRLARGGAPAARVRCRYRTNDAGTKFAVVAQLAFLQALAAA